MDFIGELPGTASIRWESYTENVDALSADDLQVLIKAAIILRPIPEGVYFLAQEVDQIFIRVSSSRNSWRPCAAWSPDTTW